MGYDYSYNCTKATIREDMGADKRGDRILFCDLEFYNEHGHEMAPVRGIVALRSYGATIVSDASDILLDTLSEEEWEKTAEALGPMLDSGNVGFDIHNQEEIGKSLQSQL